MACILELYNMQHPFGGIWLSNIANSIPSNSSINTSHGIFVLCGIISIAIILICFLKNNGWFPPLSSMYCIASKFVGASESLDLSH